MPDSMHIAYRATDWGQPILRRNAAEAYRAVLGFLQECTDWTGQWNGGSLTIFDAGPRMAADYDPTVLVTAATAVLGPSRRYPGIVHAATGEQQFKHEWQVPSTQHPWAVALVVGQPRESTNALPSISYAVSTQFRLRDPRTGEILVGQDEPAAGQSVLRSSLLLHLTTRPAASFDLAFPFPEPTQQFLDFVAAVRPHLPVRLARTAFRQMVPGTRSGLWRVRRIAAGLFDGL